MKEPMDSKEFKPEAGKLSDVRLLRLARPLVFSSGRNLDNFCNGAFRAPWKQTRGRGFKPAFHNTYFLGFHRLDSRNRFRGVSRAFGASGKIDFFGIPILFLLFLLFLYVFFLKKIKSDYAAIPALVSWFVSLH
jgi:hypothetical protein